MKKYLLAIIAMFITMMLLNALLFPVFFPDGPPDKFRFLREHPLNSVHLFAILLETVLAVGGYGWFCRPHSTRTAALFGIFLGLIISVPHALHTFALVQMEPIAIIAPVVFTIAVWGIASLAMGFVVNSPSLSHETAPKKVLST